MSNTSVQAIPNGVTDPPVITIYEPKKKSLGQRVFSAFVLGVKALFLSASAAGGVALMSMGGAVCMPIGATLFGCSSFLGFLLVKRQIDSKGSKLESQIKAHASLIAAQRDAIERQAAVAQLNANSLGRLHHEVTMVCQVHKDLEDTSHRLVDGVDSIGKLSEEMWKMFDGIKAIFISMKSLISTATKAAIPDRKAK